MTHQTCRICDNSAAEELVIREHMYGTEEEFRYSRCLSCGTVQIVDVPPALGDYYPSDYYSFRAGLTAKRRVLLTASALLHRAGLPWPEQRIGLGYLLDLLPRSGGRVLDVGCGGGSLIEQLSYFGHECTGVDPYLREGFSGKRVTLLKEDLEAVTGSFDLIMSHHSLEHMSDPHGVFASARRLISRGGHFVVRVPVIPNNVWDRHGTNWPQLDAPRHLFTFSLEGLKLLANRHQFSVDEIFFDASPWPLAAARAYAEHRALVDIPSNELRGTPEDAEETELANGAGYGDQVRLTLRAV